jgi:glutamyl-tRNA synthetase
VPQFAHLALIKTKEGGMSKRDGGYDICSLRHEGIEAMAIASLLARLGTSAPIEPHASLTPLIAGFDLKHFGRAPANYDKAELERVNAKIVSHLSFTDVAPRLQAVGLGAMDASFWETIRPNVTRVEDAALWWRLCFEAITPQIDDPAFVETAASLLPPEPWDRTTWQHWVTAVKEQTGRKGKELFMPLRRALTGMDHGPELGDLLPMIGYAKAKTRLSISSDN